MGATIGQLLGYAVVVAISPVPMIAVILVLFSRRATPNSLAFLVGWMTGLAAIFAVVLFVGSDGSAVSEDDDGGLLRVIVGSLFLLLAIKQWGKRPEPGTSPTPPGWMSSVDGMAPPKALALGVMLSALNPKNLGLTVAAGVSASAVGLSGGEQVVVAVAFVLLASASVLVPIAGHLVAPDRAAPVLASSRDWLMLHGATVMTVLFVVLGAKVLGDGISALA
jgi:hypothetical protein